jgi:hypothetical protein
MVGKYIGIRYSPSCGRAGSQMLDEQLCADEGMDVWIGVDGDEIGMVRMRHITGMDRGSVFWLGYQF